MKTLHNSLSAADLCRANGWTPGTRLVGTEGIGKDWEHTDVIEITAVGKSLILARAVYGDHTSEGTWTLSCREWQVVEREWGKKEC